MRAYIKKEIFQSINMLKDACQKLKLMQCGESNELLEQCQQLALSIGNQIEQSEQSDFVTVHYLEELCEILYKLYVCKNKNKYNQIIKEISASLKKIERSVKTDIENSPYEIVFMPYKASMWDALDSIYQAAVQDKHCHVTVLPVPYYSMNQKDGQVETHYEGDQFPGDILVTDFRTYSLETMHPDVIFIHNPYDQCNYVAQLSQQYFSTNLVRYTKYLIYIPYFITMGDSVKEQYCIMPAVQNAWRTFVQSEAVRKCYLKYGADPERIVAMGSPKFDMVLKMQKNPPELPKEWREVLEGRKVFFLNTHLTPIINKAENVLNKLRQVFRLFGQQNDVALLWRPHPLSIETLKSMNPKMLEQYLELVEEFKTLQNGVYDDTPDVHRAIAVSDVYIGDWSSLVAMYGITGKPVYLFHMEANNIFASEEKSAYRFGCGVILDGVLWAPSENSNALCKVNLETNTAEYVTSFKQEDRLGIECYHRAIFFEDRIYFIPLCAKYFAVYHLRTSEITYINFEGYVNNVAAKFSEAIQYKSYLYLFPAKMPHVVRLNMQNEEIDYFPECVTDLEQVTGLPFENNPLFLGGMEDRGIAWITSQQINCLIEYHMEDNKYYKHFIGEKKTAFKDVASDGERFYILNMDDEVLVWTSETNESEVIWKPSDTKLDCQFMRIICLEGCLWLMPGKGNEVVCINLKEKKNRVIEISKEYTSLNNEKCKAYTYVVQDNKIILCPAYAKEILEIDCSHCSIRAKKIELGSRFYNEWMEDLIPSPENPCVYDCLYDENLIPLQYFINLILSGGKTYSKERAQCFQQMQCNVDGKCGQMIWQTVRRKLG